jgi:hypothetical protein
MSQEPETTLTTARKARQRRRNRPVLVTGRETTTANRDTDEFAASVEIQTEPLAESAVAVAEPKPASRFSRLPRFFSKVEKEESEISTSEEDVAKARLARAARSKGGKAQVTGKAEQKEDATKESSKPAKPAAPPRLFKPRHFIGMGIYLIGAQMVLPLEYTLAHNLGLEKTFFTIPLFGQNLPIDTSLFLNIATLVILLYALVKLDFLPSTLTARSTAEQRARAARSGQGSKEPTEKVAPPVIKQGVKGVDDDLYQEFRQNQRREKKR